MDEYISKHEAYIMMKDLEAAYIYPPVKEAYGTAARRIDQMPAADVQPVKRGRWITTDDVEHFIAVCSECGRTEDSRAIKDMPYCHCGAKMDIIYEDDKIRAIKVTGWGDDTRNLTDEETNIYNDRLDAEAKTIDEISLL